MFSSSHRYYPSSKEGFHGRTTTTNRIPLGVIAGLAAAAVAAAGGAAGGQ